VHSHALCPLLSCARAGLHLHVACQSCGAVGHANFNCLFCMRWQVRRWGSRCKDGSVSLFRVRVKMLARGLP
jgi:hypothetical protein